MKNNLVDRKELSLQQETKSKKILFRKKYCRKLGILKKTRTEILFKFLITEN